jgi:PPK2 family polyphosphate:nucleotide phosphotransferase
MKDLMFPDELRVRPNSEFSLSDAHASEKYEWKKADAESHTKKNIEKLEDLQFHLYADGSKSLLVVLQGIDGAGKDGVVRKVFSAFNPQGTVVTSFKAPNSTELSHDYLWRVHAACPPKGTISVFNRSHYEDLIVPTIKGTMKSSELRVREKEIINFDKMLADQGTTIVKFLLHISRDEQWERMMSRLDDPTRNWKFSMGDLEERKKWDLYQKTFQGIVQATSTNFAPWHVIPANSKWFRDLSVSEILRNTLEGMSLQWPKPSHDVDEARELLNKLK